MKRSFSFAGHRELFVVTSGTCLIAATYGLVRLAYGLFLPDIQRDLSLSASVAGYVSAGSSLVYCLAAAAGFAFAAQAARTLIVVAAISACGGVVGMCLTSSAVIFGTCAVISSAGAGLASPALVVVVQRNVAAASIDRAQSTVNAGTGPGLVVAGVLALVFLPQWRTAWVVVSVLTAGFAAAVLAADRRAPTAEPTVERRGLSWVWVVRHAHCLVAAALMGAGSSVVWTYGRSLLVETGVGSGRVTISAWVALGLGASAVIVTARLLAPLTPAQAWMLSCILIACAVAVLATKPSSVLVAFGACLVFGWGFTAATSSLIWWTTVIAPAHAAAGTAMLFIALVFGQAVGAGVLGFAVTAAGFGTAFALAAVLAAAAAAPAAMSRS